MVIVGYRHEPNGVCERVFLFADFWINALEVTLACGVRVCAPCGQRIGTRISGWFLPIGWANGVISYVAVPAGLDKVSFWFNEYILG